MATMQRFKFLGNQYGVTAAQSPTRSPSTSPLVQLPRRKASLWMLLSGRLPSRKDPPQMQRPSFGSGFVAERSKRRGKEMGGQTLRELFVSASGMREEEVPQEVEVKKEMRSGVFPARPVWSGFSRRLLRRAWRPMLPSIPE